MSKIDILFDGTNISSFSCEGYNADEVLKILHLAMGVGAVKAPSPIEKPLYIKSEVETYDMKELGKSIRMPKTTTNFRCPYCGQAIMMYTDQDLLLCRDITVNPAVLYEIQNDLVLPSLIDYGYKNVEKIRLVYEDLITMSKDVGETKILIESDINCKCPICQSEDTIKNFIKAYEKPLDYFDEEQICDICGEYGTIVLTENGDSVLCDNNCYDKLTINN